MFDPVGFVIGSEQIEISAEEIAWLARELRRVGEGIDDSTAAALVLEDVLEGGTGMPLTPGETAAIRLVLGLNAPSLPPALQRVWLALQRISEYVDE
jgi:hypothetical protein